MYIRSASIGVEDGGLWVAMKWRVTTKSKTKRHVLVQKIPQKVAKIMQSITIASLLYVVVIISRVAPCPSKPGPFQEHSGTHVC